VTKLEIVPATSLDGRGEPDAAYASTGHALAGGSRARLVSPPGFSLWMVAAELDDGASITWPEVHGDEAVYVVEGRLAVDAPGAGTRTTPARGAAIVEAGAPARARAVGPTRVVHMGPRDPQPPTDGVNGPPLDAPRGVHVVGPRGTWTATDPSSDSHYYADSTCPTCRITLLSVGRRGPYESAVHSHTQDELIHVVAGGIRLGRRHVGPGDTLAIAAGTRYGFRGDDDGFVFLNHRRDASYQCWPGDVPRRLEGGAVNGMTPVMDLVEGEP
jgi:quercetin dioxygenase-like cupin family protein